MHWKLKGMRLRRSAIAVLSLGVALVHLTPQPAHAAPPTIPPGSIIAGMTYGDWAAAWWQYVTSMNVDENPLTDTADCAEGQSVGPVFFLVGNQGGSVERDCTVPAGKNIFFPIINFECSTNEGDGPTDRELRFCAGEVGDLLEPLVVEVDDEPVVDLVSFRAQSPSYTQQLPRGRRMNIFGATPGAGRGVTDGYWIALEPLAPGEHTIFFSGRVEEFDFALDVLYNITVE